MALKEYQLLYLDNDIPINRSFYCNNGDIKSRGLEVHVLDNSQAKDCTGLTLKMIIKVPSGDLFEATVENGLVTVLNAAGGIYQVLFPNNMGKGRLIAEIQLSNTVPEVIVSRKFSIVASGIQESDAVWLQGRGLCLKDLSVDTAGRIKPYYKPNKSILFLGDSITAGVNVLGTGATAQNNSGELAYPHICADLLNAIPIQVGFGATGIIAAGSGGVPKTIDFVDFAMSNVPENTETPAAICINQGTNEAGVSSASYKAAYIALVNKLKAKYPQAPIFLIIPFNGAHAQDVIDVATSEGLYYFDGRGLTITTSDGVHPNVAGHATAGTALAEKISETLGKYHFI